MYEIAVEQEFEAAHYLRGYQGKCERMHGHHFRVVARLRARDLDGIGIAYDFTVLRDQIGPDPGPLRPRVPERSSAFRQDQSHFREHRLHGLRRTQGGAQRGRE